MITNPQSLSELYRIIEWADLLGRTAFANLERSYLMVAKGDRMYHAQDGLYFGRRENGDVVIELKGGKDHTALIARHIIPPSMWASAVATVSQHDDTAEAHAKALEFHGEVEAPAEAEAAPAEAESKDAPTPVAAAPDTSDAPGPDGPTAEPPTEESGG